MDSKNCVLIKVVNKDTYTFFNSEQLEEFTVGTHSENIKVRGKEIAGEHLHFFFDKFWYVQDVSDKRNSWVNKKQILDKPMRIKEGDVISIRPSIYDKKTTPLCALEVIKKIYNTRGKGKKDSISLTNKNEYYLGSSEECDIVIEGDAEPKHCKIVYDGNNCFVEDLHSLNGTFVNNKRIKRAKLEDYDRIAFGGVAYIFLNKTLLASKGEHGIEIEAISVEKVVYDKHSKRKITLVDDISLKIPAGAFVGVVGGSGAGKSTFIDCINGVRPCTSGKVMYDGNDYYENINSYRGVVGIVPQKDIMHEDLTVAKALFYTAKIRMRRKLSRTEIWQRVQKAIEDVQLQGRENLKISALSGGQKKRVSIAMELLAEPKVIFLDEPTSGLSPDLDLEMMELLKNLASNGRTIIVITHAMDNIKLCDKVIVLGKGGKLCYFGSPDGMFKFFKTKEFAKIFFYLSDETKAEKFQKTFAKVRGSDEDVEN